LWTILGMIKEFKFNPFATAVYSGKGKPTSADDYLQVFISEMKLVLDTGFTYHGRKYQSVVGAFLCEALAHAFYLMCKRTCRV